MLNFGIDKLVKVTVFSLSVCRTIFDGDNVYNVKFRIIIIRRTK